MLVSNLRRSFCRFVKPAFYNIKNPEQLLLDTKPLIRQLKQSNVKLANFQDIQSPLSIIKGFRLSSELLNSINTRQVKFHCYDSTNRQYDARQNVNGRVIIDAEPLEIPVSQKPDLRRNFTIERGVLDIEEIHLMENEILMLNLPRNTTSQTIRNYINNIIDKPYSIDMTYCMLGLPAQVTITFSQRLDAERVKLQIMAKPIEDADRRVVVKGPESNDRQRICNRRLAINQIGKGEKAMKLLAELSKFGRVIHLDFPHTVRRNASKQQIYSLYKDSDEVIKVTQHFESGKTQTQYYPPSKFVELKNHRIEQFSKQMLNKYSLDNEQYFRRLQYAQEISVYPDSQQKILHENKGYCLVLFSCSEEAQNCYFHLQNSYDINLVTDYEFNYDNLLKKQILRYIDNEAVQRQIMAVKNKLDPEIRDQFFQINLIKDIFDKLEDRDQKRVEQIRNTPNRADLNEQSEFQQSEAEQQQQRATFKENQAKLGEKTEEQPVGEQVQTQQGKAVVAQGQWNYKISGQQSQKNTQFLQKQAAQRVKYQQVNEQDSDLIGHPVLQPQSLIKQRQIKQTYKKDDYVVKVAREAMNLNNMNSKIGRSFSELAEIELFGRIVPKKSAKSRDHNLTINFDYNPEHDALVKQAQELAKYDVVSADAAYMDIRMGIQNEYNRQYQKIAQRLQRQGDFDQLSQLDQTAENGNNPPKAQFSTTRQQNIYRKLTHLERTQQIMAYNSLIKKLVNEYFGRFHIDQLISNKKTYELPTINRKQLKFSNGEDFLTDDQIPHILNFHYSQQQAQRTFINYCKAEEAFKSLPIGTRQQTLKDNKDRRAEMSLFLADVGVVEEVFEAPENVREVVKEMNLFQSKQGEEYSVIQRQGKEYVVKLAKQQPLIPLSTLSKLQEVEEQGDLQGETLEGTLLKTMEEHGYSVTQALKHNGYSQQEIDELMEQLVQDTQIPMKVYKTLMNVKEEHFDLLAQDRSKQLALQKMRMEKQPLNKDRLIKDPSLNEVLENNKRNRFLTSGYKQL